MEKENEMKFKVGDMVINLNTKSFGHEYGVMEIISIDHSGDFWCRNKLINKKFYTYGICQTPLKLTLVTKLLMSLV